MILRKKLGRNIFIAGIAAAAVACGQKDSGNPEEANEVTANPVIAGQSDLVSVQVSISDTESDLQLTSGQGLGLTATASDFSLDITDCASGYQSLGINSATTALNVYKGDLDCKAKLRSLTVDGVTYAAANAGSVDFPTYSVGDTAVFKDSSNTLELTLSIVETLTTTAITGTQTIDIAFTEIERVSDQTISQGALGESHSISVAGEAAPAVTVSSYALMSVTANGAGQFQFGLDCEEALTDSGTKCKDQLITSMKYILVKEEAAYVGGDLSFSQAQGLIQSANAVSVLAGDLTATGFDISLIDGPDQMHNNPNMILLIGINDTSFRYVNIDLDTLQ